MGEKWPETVDPDFCIACGHCVAVCPHMALDHVRTPLAEQIQLPLSPVLDREKVYQFLRSRRSVRCYKKLPVAKEELLQLMDIARFAPTGSNSQGLSYSVIADAEKLRQITALTIDWMEEQVNSGSERAKNYRGYIQAYRSTGRDVILRNAPCLVIANAPKDFSRGRDNTCYSLAYVELYAPSMGLGTCWAGFFEGCAFSGYTPLLNLLQLPDDRVVTGAIMVGYPVYRYHRLVDRNPLAITLDYPAK